ncbi:MAG: ABC transporter substrate-binding protein [Candidatus Hodarchaeota archaeon]
MYYKKLIPLTVMMIFLSIGFFTMIQLGYGQPEYFFITTLIVPTNDTVRVQYAQLITNELPKIGIQGNLVLVGWDVLISRMFTSATYTGYADYANGGFDIGFVSWFSSIIPSQLYQFFHSEPNYSAAWSSNFYPVNNAALDGMLEYTVNTTDFDQRKEWIGKVLKAIVWDIHPVTSIYQPEDVFYLRDNIHGFDSNLGSVELMYFKDGQSAGHGKVNELVWASTSRPQGYNPLVSNSYHDTLVFDSALAGMITRDTDLDFITEAAVGLPYPVAVINNYTGLVSSTDPNTATVWEIELRNNVYWHEGYGYTMAADSAILNFDADDVVWFYKINIADSPNGPPSHRRSYYQYVFGTDPDKAIVKASQYKIQFHLSNLDADLMDIFTDPVLPQHVLDPTYDAGYGIGVRKDGTSAPSYGNWASDDYNLGYRTSGDISHAATIGIGPYVLYPGVNELQQTVTLTKNTHYWKDTETTYWKGLVETRPDKYIYTWIGNKDSAEIALEAGDIDLMDAQYNASKDYPIMKNKPGIAVEKQLAWSFQTMGYNILNGAGGKLTNRYTRLAISHLIPRQDIVDYLLGGLGQPSFVPFPLQSSYWPGDALQPIMYNYTRAIEYMKMAGYDLSPYITIQPSLGFEVLAFFVAMGGMAIVVLVYRHRKQVI